MQLHDLTFAPLLTEGQIAERVAELGTGLAAKLDTGAADTPLLIAVLNGAAIFHADLARACSAPLELAYLRTRSYRGTDTTGEVELHWPDDLDVRGRRVVLVEDIVDSGHTLSLLVEATRERGATEVSTVVLLDKPAARRVAFVPDVVGFAIDEAFVVGYGLDYDGLGRNLAGVWQRSPAT